MSIADVTPEQARQDAATSTHYGHTTYETDERMIERAQLVAAWHALPSPIARLTDPLVIDKRKTQLAARFNELEVNEK